MLMRTYKHFRQLDTMDCGPTCLKMIAYYYGKKISSTYLCTHANLTPQGVTVEGLIHAAEKIGFKVLPVKLTYQQLVEKAKQPCILHWNRQHFVVLYAIRRKVRNKEEKIDFLIADPSCGLMRMDISTFLPLWTSHNNAGVALLLEPTFLL